MGLYTLARSQSMEGEPNNTCAEPQVIGEFELPYNLEGNLDYPVYPPPYPTSEPYPPSPAEPKDIDYYSFLAEPGSQLVVGLEGASTGKGTLREPLLGLYDSSCALIASSDRWNPAGHPRLTFTVPADGVFILAVSVVPDFSFSEGGSSGGTYQLTLSPIQLIGSILGRLVNAVNGEPLRGDQEPYGTVDLLLCNDVGECGFFVNTLSTDGEGRFSFTTDFLAGAWKPGIIRWLPGRMNIICLNRKYLPSRRMSIRTWEI
jgi:hypothetical protein